jgi:hypothetical protein
MAKKVGVLLVSMFLFVTGYTWAGDYGGSQCLTIQRIWRKWRELFSPIM